MRCPDATSRFSARPPPRPRHAAPAAVPGRHRAGHLRDGLLLGRRAPLLAGPGHVHDRGRLRRRLHPEPDLRGDLQRAHRATPRPCSPSSTRPRRATRSCCASSGRATTPPRACGRETTSARSTGRRSTGRARRSATPRSPRASASRRRSTRAGHGTITTEIAEAGPFYYAEDYHQQYLARNPFGYCGLGGTGVACPIDMASPASP